MTKDEVISRITCENEVMKKRILENKIAAEKIVMRFICVGRGILNDNTLGFNKEQMLYLKPILEEAESICEEGDEHGRDD